MIIGIFGPQASAHYLSEKLLTYPNVTKVYHFDANPNLTQTDRYIPVSELNSEKILKVLNSEKFDLLIPMYMLYQLWPELHIYASSKNIPMLGPSEICANLEWSKVAGKKLLTSLDIPTAKSTTVSRGKLLAEYSKIPRPFVLKFDKDWRAGAQTIVVTDENYKDVLDYLKTTGKHRLMAEKFGEFENQTFVIEEYIHGLREYSYHAVCAYDSWTYLGSARDYKKHLENDIGPNTPGMGSYGPVEPNPRVHKFTEKILQGLKNINQPYLGILYLGIMEDQNGDPIVLEINTRFGDPEIFTLIPSIEDNIANLFLDAAKNKQLKPLTFNDKKTVAIRIVHNDIFNPNFIVDGQQPKFAKIPNDIIISRNAGDNYILHSIFTSTKNTVKEASDTLYDYLKLCDMGSFTYRKDIGYFK